MVVLNKIIVTNWLVNTEYRIRFFWGSKKLLNYWNLHAWEILDMKMKEKVDMGSENSLNSE